MDENGTFYFTNAFDFSGPSGTSSALYSRSGLSGTTTLVANYAFTLALSLALVVDALYGINAGNGFLYEIEKSTGDLTFLLDLEPDSGSTYAALAGISVPEPATLALMGLGLAGIGLLHRTLS